MPRTRLNPARKQLPKRRLSFDALERRELLAVTVTFISHLYVGVEDGPITGPGPVVGKAIVKVRATNDSAGAASASVNYRTEQYSGSPSAVSGVDFQAVSGTLNFNLGGFDAQELSFDVPFIADNLTEDDERFLVVFEESFGTIVDRETALVQIYDDDRQRPPRAVDDEFSVSPIFSGTPLPVLGNDSDWNGNPIFIVEVDPNDIDPVTEGTVTWNSTTIFFTPSATRPAPYDVFFTYEISDGFGIRSGARVNVGVGKPPAGNPPISGGLNFVAEDDTATDIKNFLPKDITVLGNDSHPGAFIDGFTQPQHGTVELIGNNTFRYRSHANYVGEDYFSYAAGLPIGGSFIRYSAATVKFQVGGYTAIPTILPYTDDSSQFEMLDYNADTHQDLVQIKKWGTASGKTEIRILSGAPTPGPRYHHDLVNIPTVFLETNANWEFFLADWNHDPYFDLVGIVKGPPTGSGMTEVHIAAGGPGASNFQTFVLHQATIFPLAGSEVEFEVGELSGDSTLDVVAVKKDGASGKTEMHILNGATLFQSYVGQIATGFLQTDAAWNFEITNWDGVGPLDLVGIKRVGTGTQSTELHILSGSSNWQSFIAQFATQLPETPGPYEYMVLDFDDGATKDLIAVRKQGGPSNTTEVLAPGKIIIDPLPPQHSPTAISDQASVVGGGPHAVTIDVLANDFDIDGQTIYLSGFAQWPVHGDLTLNEAGHVVYQPAPNYVGPDSFVYQVSDSTGRRSNGTVTITVTNAVVGRAIFYNQSKFDGNTVGVSASDDLAIAVDKSAYLPGSGPATFANITSYSRGINGIMIDLADVTGALSAADFTFRVSTQESANNAPSTWQLAPAPAAISVRPGAGVGGSDRVEVIWNNGAIANRWLEVIVEGNDAAGGVNTNTGLAASDLFFFGNRIGDVGSGTPTLAVTNAADEIDVRNNGGAGAAITNLFDFDRNGLVNAVDRISSRNNAGTLTKINLTSPPAAPADGATLDSAAIAQALSLAPASARASGATASLAVPRVSSAPARPRFVVRELLEVAASKSLLAAAQAVAALDVDELAVADEILELLASAN